MLILESWSCVALLSLVHLFGTGLGVSYIVNAPSLYTFAWNLLSPFLDSVTKSKIQFVSINKDTVCFTVDDEGIHKNHCQIFINLDARSIEKRAAVQHRRRRIAGALRWPLCL